MDETIGFESAYRVEGADFIVPDTKITNYNAFDSIDLSYYHQKCKCELKNIYENRFKQHEIYIILRNNLQRHEHHENLINQVFER